jgi:3-methyladenine DNA glycosylase AlkD
MKASGLLAAGGPIKRRLLERLRAEFRRHGDARRAAGQRAYMKSEMPFHGVATPQWRRICREVFSTCVFRSGAEWRAAVRGVFRGARFREERHAAIELAWTRRFAAFEDLRVLPLYEEMIVTGAWWDYVDAIATHHLGRLLRKHPREMKREMLRWSRDENLWKRRAAILCQIGRKGETDLDLLYRAIEPSLDSREFFLRKAIGWALRQYAWWDPREVRRYVRENEDRLSGLSRREALKNLGKRSRPQNASWTAR